MNHDLLEKHKKINLLECALEKRLPGDSTPPPRGCSRPLLADLLDTLEWDVHRAQGIVQLVTDMLDPAQKNTNTIVSSLQHAVGYIKQYGDDPEQLRHALQAYKQGPHSDTAHSYDHLSVEEYEALLRG